MQFELAFAKPFEPDMKPRKVGSLLPGGRAFVILRDPCGKTGQREKVRGAAQVEVMAVGRGGYLCRVVKSRDVKPGTPMVFPRRELHATAEEREYFAQLVGFIWNGEPIMEGRPESLDSEEVVS